MTQANSWDRSTRRRWMQELAVGMSVGGWAGVHAWGASPSDSSVEDRRRGKLTDLNGYFPFEVPATAEEWARRSEFVRRQIRLASGLWPMPERPPIQATIHGAVDRDEYTVERVFFEAVPGLYVTGSLYRPKGEAKPRAGILCPHGHWQNGRFYDHGELQLRKEIEAGAERFDPSGRYPLQARCAQLARMGCIVFHYDMLGYADSAPLPQSLAHGFRKQRPSMSQPDHWGLFSAQAELRLLNPLGLQTLQSVRALDFLLSLDDVDPDRIGVTGASGGGTQTFILTAVDDRPAAAFPAVMVSTAMQGGCTCENASYLRVNTGNIEIAALCAPRPLGMVAADDWTKELETKGLPELRKLYEMLGVGDRVEGKYYSFPHNYNAVSRAMMYAFFNKHLKLGVADPIEERPFEPLTQDELTVWTSDHPKPAMTEDAERAMLASMAAASDRQLDTTVGDAEARRNVRQTIRDAWQSMIGRTWDDVADVQFVENENEGIRTGSLRLARFGETVPVAMAMPTGDVQGTVIWITPTGKAELMSGGGLLPVVQKLVDGGRRVVAIDVAGQGGTIEMGLRAPRSRAIENGREASCFVFGYNHPLFAQRVHDILTAVRWAEQNAKGAPVELVGTGGTAGWAAAAAVVAGESVHRLAVDTDGFRFAQIVDIEDPELLPGAVKYGDLPVLLSLMAHRPMWIGGEGSRSVPAISLAYQDAGARGSIVMDSGRGGPVTGRMVDWLLQTS